MGILYLGNQKVTPFVYKDAGNKYGAAIDTFLGDTNNGVLQRANSQDDIVFSNVTDLASAALYYKFIYTSIKSISFPNLTSISGSSACWNMCQSCTNLKSISYPELTTVSVDYAMYNAFQSCTGLTTAAFPKLTTISGNYQSFYGCFYGCSSLENVYFDNLTSTSGSNVCAYMFYMCSKLASISFPKLESILGSGAWSTCFSYCTKLENIYFPSLKTTSFGSSHTNQFSSMLSGTGTTVTHTIHFPSNLESTIQGLTGYPLFGGTSGYVVLSFDLPATE